MSVKFMPESYAISTNIEISRLENVSHSSKHDFVRDDVHARMCHSLRHSSANILTHPPTSVCGTAWQILGTFSTLMYTNSHFLPRVSGYSAYPPTHLRKYAANCDACGHGGRP